MLARRARAEELTDELVGPAYDVLSPDDAGELLELLSRVAAVTAAVRAAATR